MAIPITSVTFGIDVSDLAASTEWYERLLGPAGESPGEGMAEFPLPGGSYLLLSEVSAPSGVDGSVILGVADLAATRSAVQELGLDLSATEEIPGVLHYFSTTDPDGHTVTFVQLPD